MRIFMFICFILLLIIGWGYGWFFVADKFETAITDTKQKLADNGQTLACEAQNIDGFPFRISLNCNSLEYANPTTGVLLTTGALKSAAQAYQPNKLVAEIQSPARLTLPGANNFDTQWQSMRTSLTAGLSGPDRFSIQGKDLQILPESETRPDVEIAELQIHGRRNGENAIDFALSLDDATTQQKPWPDYDLNFDIRLDEIYSDLIAQTDFLTVAKTKGIQGEIYNLKYSALSGGTAAIEGPMEINQNGILTGKFQVTVSELPKLLDALARAFPAERENIEKASTALISIAGSKKDAEFKLPVIVKNGKVIVGIFPIADIPPLF